MLTQTYPAQLNQTIFIYPYDIMANRPGMEGGYPILKLANIKT